MKVLQPLAIPDIAFAAWYVLHVSCIDEDDLEAARVEDLENGNPVDPGGLHRDVRDATGREPIRQSMQIAGERGKRSHRCRVPIGRHGDKVFSRSAIDAGGVWMETVKRRGLRARLRRRMTAVTFHQRLL